MRPIHRAVIGQSAEELGELKDANQYLSLADGVVEYQTPCPAALSVASIVVLGVGVQTGRLHRQIDTGGTSEAAQIEIPAQLIDAQFQPKLIEVDIARLFYSADSIDGSMPGRKPAAEIPVAELIAAQTRAERRVAIDDALLEAGPESHELGGRTRRIQTVERPVQQRVGGVAADFLPEAFGDDRRKDVGIVTGIGYHGQHLAVARIHGDDGTAAERIQSRRGGPLYIQIDREIDIRPGDRRLRWPVRVLPHSLPRGRNLDILRSLPSPQVLIVLLLQPLLPDHTAQAVVDRAQLLEFVLGNLTNVAGECLGTEESFVLPDTFHLVGNAREGGALLFEYGNRFELNVSFHRRGLVAADHVAGDSLPHGEGIHTEQFRQSRDGDVVHLFGRYHRNGIGRAVVYYDTRVTVIHATPARDDGHDPDAVVFRLRRQLGVIDHLQSEQTDSEHQADQQNQADTDFPSSLKRKYEPIHES